MAHPKAGEKGYHRYATAKFADKREVLAKLRFYGVKPKRESGRGAWKSWISAWENFKRSHTVDEFEEFKDIKQQHFDVENMSNIQKRAFAKNF